MNSRVSVLVILTLASFAPRASGQTVAIDPTPSFSIARSLRAAERHDYAIELTAETFGRLTFDQQGIDVVVTIDAPDGHRVADVDRPNTAYGREAVSIVARQSGTYRVQVRSLSATALPGSYRLTVMEVRRPIPLDASRVRAEQAITEGESLRAANTAAACRQAVERFQESLALWRVLHDRYEQMWALYGLGLSYRFLGEQQRAVTVLSEALQIARDLADLHGRATAEVALGWAYLYLGETERARRHFVATLPLRKSLGDLLGEALTETGIAWSYALLSKQDVALPHFRAAIDLRRKLGDHRGEALAAIGLGKVLVVKGRHREALEVLTSAVATLRPKTSDGYSGFHYAEALSQLGWANVAARDPDAAIAAFREALPLRRAAGDRAGEATTLFGMARAEWMRGRIDDARLIIEPALDIVETLRSQGDNLQLRMSYFASVQAYYMFAIDVLMALHQLQGAAGHDIRAYDVHQRARARGLLDLLQESRVDIRSDVAPDLLAEERQARQDLNAATERHQFLLARRATDETRRQTAEDLADAVARHEAIEQRMRSSSATYQSLAEPRPLGAKDVQRDLLDPQTLLLDYAVGSERSFVWAITRDTIRAYELPPRAQLEKAVRHFRGAIAARAEHRANETPAEWHARAAKGDLRAAAAVRTLSNLVLAPVWRDHTARRIVVVPHGVLQLIPFGLLPVPSESSTRGGHSTPLILRQEVVHLPSVSALAWLRSGKTRSAGASKVIAIFADPIFERADERVVVNRPLATETPVQASIIDRPPLFPSASRLFATRWEAGQIAALVPKDQTWVLMDSTASRSTALDARLGRYRVVHFATHAFVDDRRPSLGGILLSRVDAGGRAVPGFLSLQDVFTLRLRTELVVLGGCRTGLGTMVEGEGFLSLSRGFFHAGVPRVIAGLWAVDDVATAQLMVYFYRAMFGPSRLSPAAALRAAQLEMQKNPRWQSPYYWAGFVLQGEWT